VAAKEIAANLAAWLGGVKPATQSHTTAASGNANVTVDLEWKSSEDAPNDSSAGRMTQNLEGRRAA